MGVFSFLFNQIALPNSIGVLREMRNVVSGS